MSCASRSLIVAASVGVVEVLKDQGVCRWNSALRSLHHHAKKSITSPSSSYTQARKLSPCLDSSSATPATKSTRQAEEKRKQQLQAEESLRKVMYLSCWGPN